MNEQENQNQVAAEVVKKSPGRPRINMTKVFRVIKPKNSNAFRFLGRGKPSNGAEVGEVVLSFDYDKNAGIPAGIAINNIKTVNYVAIPKVKEVAPAVQ